MTNEYVFRPYAFSDSDRIINLFKECFGKNKDRSEWSWCYHDSPHGQSSVVCFRGGELVGFYGVIHRPLFHAQTTTMSGHVMDVMTHPDHQGKGLFVAAAKAAFKNARDNGISLFIGWPNKKAMPGHMKVGWKDLGQRRILRHDLGPSGSQLIQPHGS
jgi:GNAT superfamily N-acetyltransferase